MTVGGITEYLKQQWPAIREQPLNGTYEPKPVRGVEIPKPDGGVRKHGIPTVRDRIVQQACRIVVEPVFEANFQNQSYGFRPRRSAAQAVRAVDKVLLRGWWVVDADIQGYFDGSSANLMQPRDRCRPGMWRVRQAKVRHERPEAFVAMRLTCGL